MNFSKTLYTLVLLSVFSTGCSTLSPLYVFPSNGPLRQFPPAPASVIRLPVIVSLPTTAKLDQNLSELFHGNLKNGIPDIAHWTTEMGATAALKLMKWNVVGGQLFLSLNMDWLKAFKKSTTPTPGLTPVAASVSETQFPVHWNNQWRLEAQNPQISHSAHLLSKKVGNVIQGAQDGYSRIEMKELNSVLSGFSNLLPKAADVWNLVQDPIYIDKGIWLLIQPESVSTGIVNTDPQKPFQFNTVLEMTSHPVLYFGDHPAVQKKSLPPLKAYQSGNPGFTAVSNVNIDFKEANRFLNDPKTGIIDKLIKNTGGHHLKIKKIRLYGAAGKAIVEVHMDYSPLIINLTDKPAHMVIYFRGTPRYNAKRQTLYMPDLDFDIKTSDFLVQAAEWILKSDIRKELRHKAHIPLGPVMEKLKDRMNVVLNCPVGSFAHLETRVESFRVLDAFVERNGLNARVALNGTAQLNVTW